MPTEKSGTQVLDVSDSRRSRMCLDDAVVARVARTITNVHAAYRQLFGYADIDTEFAVAADSRGELSVHMLQARPVVSIAPTELKTVEPEAASKAEVLVRGSYSLLGATTGKLKVIEHFEDLVSGAQTIQPDDILVTNKTANYWTSYVVNLRAIVAFEGSATAHPMLCGRERGIPVVCGVPGATPELLHRLAAINGSKVTIDGLTRALYLGELPLREFTAEEFESRFGLTSIEQPPAHEDSLKFLKMYGRLWKDEKDGSLWVFNPNVHLSPAWCELRATSYPQRWPLVNNCRVRPLPESANMWQGTRTRVVTFPDGTTKIADELEPLAQTLKMFEGMTADECLTFCDHCDEVSKEYLGVCAEFRRGATVARWRAHCTADAKLYGAMWLNYFSRVYINFRHTTLARQLGVAQIHFDDMLSEIQRDQPGEDEFYQNALSHIALAMLPILRGNPPPRRPQLLAMIENAASNWRSEKETDITRPLPIEQVLHSALEAAFRLSQSPKFAEGNSLPAIPPSLLGSPSSTEGKVVYFPEEAELHKWALASIRTRVWMCSAHHVKIRGQNLVKDELLAVARVNRFAVWTDILLCKTMAEIEGFIEAYEKSDKDLAPLQTRARVQGVHERNAALHGSGSGTPPTS